MFEVETNPNIFDVSDKGEISIKISKEANNGLHLDDVGMIVALKGPDGDSSSSSSFHNIPGNSIDGTSRNAIPYVRCNSSVSRKVVGDPDPSNEGVLMSTLLAHIFGG